MLADPEEDGVTVAADEVVEAPIGDKPSIPEPASKDKASTIGVMTTSAVSDESTRLLEEAFVSPPAVAMCENPHIKATRGKIFILFILLSA